MRTKPKPNYLLWRQNLKRARARYFRDQFPAKSPAMHVRQATAKPQTDIVIPEFFLPLFSTTQYNDGTFIDKSLI